MKTVNFSLKTQIVLGGAMLLLIGSKAVNDFNLSAHNSYYLGVLVSVFVVLIQEFLSKKVREVEE